MLSDINPTKTGTIGLGEINADIVALQEVTSHPETLGLVSPSAFRPPRP